MKNQINIREAVTKEAIEVFWEQLHRYFKRDIFSDSDDEDLNYFLGSEYQTHMMTVHERPENPCYFLFFQKNGQDIGFAMPVIFTSEDGKCFIMEYCIYPEFRGEGTGRKCADVLLKWARTKGSLYAELNYGNNKRREHFWHSVGFIKNGMDQWGEPLMILPPNDDVPITAEVLTDPEDWQLKKLENGFLNEIGEALADDVKFSHLAQAIRDKKITFLMAKRGYRAVGMCSVVKYFSASTCSEIGIFDDFYIEPAFRKKGIARRLVRAAQETGKKIGFDSLSVTCSPCDEEMYKALGFNTSLGMTLLHKE